MSVRCGWSGGREGGRRRRRSGNILTLGERPVAPLLRVVLVDDTGEQRLLAVRVGRLVAAELGAGGVEVAALGAAGDVGPPGRVLRAEALGAVEVAARAERDDDALDVRGVVAEVLPGLAARVLGERVVDGRHRGRGARVGHVVAELEEVLVAEGRVPVDLLPRGRRVVEGPADGEGDGLREVPDVRDRAEAEDGLELPDGGRVLGLHEGVDLVHDVVDAGDAVLRRELLDRVIPLRVLDLAVDHAGAGDGAPEGLGVRLDRERGQRARVAAAVEDPGGGGGVDVLDARELDFPGEHVEVGDDLLRGQVRQLIRRRRVERDAGAVVAVLQDDADAIEPLDELLDQAAVEMSNTQLDKSHLCYLAI